MSRLIVKILTAPIVLILILIMGFLSLLIRIITDIFECVAGIPVKIVGICILLALFTRNWLAAVSFTGILAVVYIVIVAATFISFALDTGRDSLAGIFFFVRDLFLLNNTIETKGTCVIHYISTGNRVEEYP